jgi:hypothetical protein
MNNFTPLHITLKLMHYTERARPAIFQALVETSPACVHMTDLQGHRPVDILSTVVVNIAECVIDASNVEKIEFHIWKCFTCALALSLQRTLTGSKNIAYPRNPCTCACLHAICP